MLCEASDIFLSGWPSATSLTPICSPLLINARLVYFISTLLSKISKNLSVNSASKQML